jgi:hypothetical protein
MSEISMTQEEISERLEHQDAILALRAIMNTEHGRNFILYLFRNFEVAELPEQFLDGPVLFEKLGFLRSGKAIFDLACEADPTTAGALLAKVKKDRYDKLIADFKERQGE